MVRCWERGAFPDGSCLMVDGLAGCRVLIVEDESLVGLLLETIIEDMGCEPVGPAATLAEGLALAASDTSFSAALLDINLGSEKSFPVAEALKARGVPVVFSTGYGESALPDAWRGHPTLQKPFTEAIVRDALMTAMDVSRA